MKIIGAIRPPAPADFDRIVRPAEAAYILGVHRSTLFRLTVRGELEKPLRVSQNACGWRLSTLLAFLDGRAARSVRSQATEPTHRADARRAK